MSIVIFWLESSVGVDESKSRHKKFLDTDLSLAMSFCEDLRKNVGPIGTKRHHITISSEISTMVGRPGVDAVENGKTPDGVDYSWVKRSAPGVKTGRAS